MRQIPIFSVVVLAAFGCQHYVAKNDLSPKPTAAEVSSLTVVWAEANLKDPESARYRGHSAPMPGYTRGPFMTVGLPGWVWRAGINARNGFGGYTGFENFWFLYAKNGIVYGAQGRWDMEPSSFLNDLGPFVIAKGVE